MINTRLSLLPLAHFAAKAAATILPHVFKENGKGIDPLLYLPFTRCKLSNAAISLSAAGLTATLLLSNPLTFSPFKQITQEEPPPPKVEKKEEDMITWFVKGGYERLFYVSDKFYSAPFSSMIQKAKYAWSLGLVKEAGGATGGAHFVLDPTAPKKPIGVVKTGEESRSWFSYFKRLFAYEIFGQRSYLRSNHSEPKAEAASSIFERSLKLGVSTTYLTPRVSLEEFDGTTGGVQEFMPGVEDKTTWFAKKAYTEKEYELFQEFALLDYALGNLDRHNENWFINTDKFGELTEIIAIDNANVFPERVNDSSKHIMGPPKNQCIWAKERIAAGVFTNSARAKAKRMYTKERCEDALKDINHNVPGFLNDKMKQETRRRFEVIRTLLSKEDFKPSDLYTYREKSAIDSLVNREM